MINSGDLATGAKLGFTGLDISGNDNQRLFLKGVFKKNQRKVLCPGLKSDSSKRIVLNRRAPCN